MEPYGEFWVVLSQIEIGDKLLILIDFVEAARQSISYLRKLLPEEPTARGTSAN